MAQLKAERDATDAELEPQAVYPYKDWLRTSSGWSGNLRPAYVAPQRKVTDPDIPVRCMLTLHLQSANQAYVLTAALAPFLQRPDYADDPEGTPHGEMAARSGKSIRCLSCAPQRPAHATYTFLNMCTPLQ